MICWGKNQKSEHHATPQRHPTCFLSREQDVGGGEVSPFCSLTPFPAYKLTLPNPTGDHLSL